MDSEDSRTFFADRLTCPTSRLATWVRNGQPLMLTEGLTGNPADVALDAIVFCAYVRATWSAITKATMSTTRMAMSQVRPRLRRRRGLRRGG